MALEGEYLGMPVLVNDLDQENLAFFSYCGQGELRDRGMCECSGNHMDSKPRASNAWASAAGVME